MYEKILERGIFGIFFKNSGKLKKVFLHGGFFTPWLRAYWVDQILPKIWTNSDKFTETQTSERNYINKIILLMNKRFWSLKNPNCIHKTSNQLRKFLKPATLNIQIYHHKEYSYITHKKIHSWYDTSNLSSNERSVTQQQVRSSLNRFLMSTSSWWVDKYYIKKLQKSSGYYIEGLKRIFVAAISIY